MAVQRHKQKPCKITHQLVLSKIKLYTNFTSFGILVISTVFIFFLLPDTSNPLFIKKHFDHEKKNDFITKQVRVDIFPVKLDTVAPNQITLNPNYKNIEENSSLVNKNLGKNRNSTNGSSSKESPFNAQNTKIAQKNSQTELELSKMYQEALDSLAASRSSEADLLANISDLRRIIEKQRKVLVKQGQRNNRTRFMADRDKHKKSSIMKNIEFKKWDEGQNSDVDESVTKENISSTLTGTLTETLTETATTITMNETNHKIHHEDG